MTSDICGIDFERRPGRGATLESSRGFQPTDNRVRLVIRRGATVDAGGSTTGGFKRRSATHRVWGVANRGLKPTATITGSLRDQRHVELADLNQEAAALAKKIQKNFEELGV